MQVSRRVSRRVDLKDLSKEARPMTWTTSVVVTAITLTTSLLVGCSSTAATTTAQRGDLVQRGQAERDEWNKVDPGVEALAKKSHGVAIFPEITKGGLGFGGAYRSAEHTSELQSL